MSTKKKRKKDMSRVACNVPKCLITRTVYSWTQPHVFVAALKFSDRSGTVLARAAMASQHTARHYLSIH